MVDIELKETIVIDDLVPEKLQDYYFNIVLNTDRWRFVKDMSYAKGEPQFPSYGFNMTFKHPTEGILSDLYESVSVPIMNAAINKLDLKVKDIAFNRAFLQIPLEERFVKPNNGIHIDLPDPHYACIYYMNDSDGDTIIYEQTHYDTPFGSKKVKVIEHKRVTPKKGRMVFFDGARYHCSTQPRNGHRCIINFDLIMEN